MKINFLEKATFLLVLSIVGLWLIGPVAIAAPASSALLKAQQESEAKGLIFITSHEEIVAKAKEEGKMRGTLSMDPAAIDALVPAFKEKYPFLDVSIEEMSGTDELRGFLLEIRSGRPIDRDNIHVPTDLYQEYLPVLKKYDLVSMAKHGVINIPIEVIDHRNPYVVSTNSSMQVTAYNKNVVARENIPLPETWEDFLKPVYKGRKFCADIRATEVAALVPAWGLEKVLDFARKLSAQEPIWVRGGTRTVTAMAVGEYALFMGPNYHTVVRAMKKDPTKSLGAIIMEPIPVRLSDRNSILAQSKHPHAALLFQEFLLSPTGQKIADQADAYTASIHSPDSDLNKATKGKKLSLGTWETLEKLQEYQQKIVEAYGFPAAETRKKKTKK